MYERTRSGLCSSKSMCALVTALSLSLVRVCAREPRACLRSALSHSLAVLIDVWSRRVVGWSMGEQMTSRLVLAALNMALAQRKPDQVGNGATPTPHVHRHRCQPAGCDADQSNCGRTAMKREDFIVLTRI